MSESNPFTDADKHLQLGDDESTVQEMSRQVELHQSQKWQALAMFHDGEGYDRERLWEKFDKASVLHGASGLTMGRILICQKEMLAHGDFQQDVEARGLHVRTAQRYMQYARAYAGFDPEIEQLLGQDKLYLIAKQAPAEVLEQLNEQGQVGDADLDELVAMSPKEISRQIKETTQKLQYELINEKAKNDGLFEDKQKLKKANEQLQAKVRQLESGESERPMWWMRGMAIVDAMAKYARFLLENDLPEDSDFRQQAEYVVGRMDRELLEIKARLKLVSAEHAAELDATNEKLTALEQDERFDFS